MSCLGRTVHLARHDARLMWWVRGVLLLALAMTAGLAAGERPAPTRQQMRPAEQLVRDFAEGRAPTVHRALSPALAAQLPVPAIAARAAELHRVGGRFLRLQAAWPRGAVAEGATTAVVPLDFEKLEAQVAVTWVGEWGPGAVVGFRVEEREPRGGAKQSRGEDEWGWAEQREQAPYVDSNRFRERAITFDTTPGLLRGYLCFPHEFNNSTRGSVVLLVGPLNQPDKDGVAGPNRPMEDLAHGLASRGIASLRFDRRELQQPASLPGELSLEAEYVHDVVHATTWLASNRQFEPRKIFLVGIGFGGAVALRVPERHPGVAGVVLLATPMSTNANHLLRGLWERLAVEDPAAGMDRVRFARQLTSLIDGTMPGGDVVAGRPASWWRDVARLDPAAAAGRLTQPILYLQPEFPADEGSPWAAVANQNPRFRRVVVPGAAGEWFLPARRGAGGGILLGEEQARLPGHMDPGVIQAITEFVRSVEEVLGPLGQRQ